MITVEMTLWFSFLFAMSVYVGQEVVEPLAAQAIALHEQTVLSKDLIEAALKECKP